MRTPHNRTYLSKKRETLKRLLRSDYSYGELSDELGISKGMLWRFVVKGWIPGDVEKQAALGIKSLVHVAKEDTIVCRRQGCNIREAKTSWNKKDCRFHRKKSFKKYPKK